MDIGLVTEAAQLREQFLVRHILDVLILHRTAVLASELPLVGETAAALLGNPLQHVCHGDVVLLAAIGPRRMGKVTYSDGFVCLRHMLLDVSEEGLASMVK